MFTTRHCKRFHHWPLTCAKYTDHFLTIRVQNKIINFTQNSFITQLKADTVLKKNIEHTALAKTTMEKTTDKKERNAKQDYNGAHMATTLAEPWPRAREK